MHVSFYHLTRTSAERALPRVLEKVLQKNERALVLCAPEKVALFDDTLWTYKPDGFLPHGTSADGRPLDHPLWITSEWQDVVKNINQSQYLVLVSGSLLAEPLPLEKCLYFFQGEDPDEVTLARSLWRRLKSEENHTMIYWKQDAEGSWVQENT